MNSSATPLPTLDLSVALAAFEWPLPPWARRNVMEALPDGPVPCRIETGTGAAVEGELVSFDARAGSVYFRVRAGGVPLALPFARFRRLMITLPWEQVRRAPGTPVEVLSDSAQQRDYRVDMPDGGHLVGRTMGHIRNDVGLFLYAPHDMRGTLLRVFVPPTTCHRLSLGKSVEELAAERWVATPDELIAAVEAQDRNTIHSVGDCLIELGFVSRGLVDLMLRQQGDERVVPLGEMLVGAGHLDRADLQTALAHKMGYPMVDLTRFPVDIEAVRRLSQQTMIEQRVLPLMQRGDRLFVAVDSLLNMARVKGLQAMAGLDVVPVLAPRGRLAIVLASLPQRLGLDLWANNEPLTVTQAARLEE